MKKLMMIAAMVAVIAMAGTAMAAGVAPGAPVSAYLFDTGSGTTAFDAFDSNDGTLNGDATWSGTTPFAYAGNNAVLFNGVVGGAGYCDLGTPANLDFVAGTDQFTIAGWFTKSADGDVAIIATKGGDPNGSVQYELSTVPTVWTSIGGNIDPNATALPGPFPSWYHLAVVVDAVNCQTYLNGVAAGAPWAWGAQLHPTDPVWIGGQYNSSVVPINWYDADGSVIDEVGFWNTALTPANMEWLANNSMSGLVTVADPIPEPAGLGLIGLALLAVRKRRS